jgi:hypothetical protein
MVDIAIQPGDTLRVENGGGLYLAVRSGPVAELADPHPRCSWPNVTAWRLASRNGVSLA